MPRITGTIPSAPPPGPWPAQSTRFCAAGLRRGARFQVRLNKYISETGVCSRREADKWIEAGRVTCNGAQATLGTQVNAGDEGRVDGEPGGKKITRIYIALNKPVGIVCTTEPHVEDNIIAHVNHAERIFPVGRLDKDSEGL